MVYIVCISILIILGYFCHKYGYSNYSERAHINAKHPNWKPYCGINFLKEDPKWFEDNGYQKYVK